MLIYQIYFHPKCLITKFIFIKLANTAGQHDFKASISFLSSCSGSENFGSYLHEWKYTFMHIHRMGDYVFMFILVNLEFGECDVNCTIIGTDSQDSYVEVLFDSNCYSTIGIKLTMSHYAE